MWIGCLACHNSGRLVGGWFDVLDADEVTSVDVHGDTLRHFAAAHEELWGFNTDSMPGGPGEISLLEAAHPPEDSSKSPCGESPGLLFYLEVIDPVQFVAGRDPVDGSQPRTAARM